MMLQIAPAMDRVGFEAIDFTTSTHMAVAVRFSKADPWERLRLFRAAAPTDDAVLPDHRDALHLVGNRQPRADGICLPPAGQERHRRFAVMDPMNNVPAMITMADLTRKAGGRDIVAALTFTLVAIARRRAFRRCCAQAWRRPAQFDRLYLKDPGGLVTPERARTLIPAIKAVMGAMPLEFHSHCTIGLAPVLLSGGAQVWARQRLHTSSSAAANGTGQPAMTPTIRNLRDLGLDVDVDDEAVAEMDD